MFGGLGTTELMIIFVIVLVIFGGKRLPALGKGLGEGMRGFRESFKGEDEPNSSDVLESSEESNSQDDS